jgi:hypothetical protein
VLFLRKMKRIAAAFLLFTSAAHVAHGDNLDSIDSVLRYRIGLTAHKVGISVLDVGNWSDFDYRGRHFRVADAKVRFSWGAEEPMQLLDTGEKIYFVNKRVIDDLKAGLPVGKNNQEVSLPAFSE